MNTQPKTQAELAIEKTMEELDPASDRYQVLVVAGMFKSSWVALGEKLLHVKRNNLFKEWGYENFEDYCSREVRIKKPTAQKLTLAYSFIEKEEPQLITRHTELKPLPDYRSVELLRQAREEKEFSTEEYAALRQAVVEENRSHPTILKRFNDIAVNRDGDTRTQTELLKAGLSAARRLTHTLELVEMIPEQYRSNLADIHTWLETRMNTLAEQNPSS